MRDAPRGQGCRSALGPDQRRVTSRIARTGKTAPAVGARRRRCGDDRLDPAYDRRESTVLPMKDGLTKVKDFSSSSAAPEATMPE
jgi:hypothetical protein